MTTSFICFQQNNFGFLKLVKLFATKIKNIAANQNWNVTFRKKLKYANEI